MQDHQPPYPVKVIQFGEGNFLRAFIDWMIDILNEKSVFNGTIAIVQPLEKGMVDRLNVQQCRYHHVRQGIENDQQVDEVRLITAVSKAINPFTNRQAFFELAEEPEIKLIFSNTTEAGIVFDPEDLPAEGTLAATFPGKLTQLLIHRFGYFQGDEGKGAAIIPCELIEQNGNKLKDCVYQYLTLWDAPPAIREWIDTSCSFANTLVDRIVPGYPKDEIASITKRIGCEDKMVVKSEAFHLFVIQAADDVKELFPAHLHGLNVKYVPDVTPYRTQKVRILNGAHSAMVPIGLLYSLHTVSEVINDPETGKLVREIIFDEIVPTIQISGADPKEFAEQVIARFQNPFIRHELVTISLNSIAKFKVRVLPTILDYFAIKGHYPIRLTFSFACLIHLYLKDEFAVHDNEDYLRFFQSLKTSDPETVIEKVLSNTDLWGQNLSKLEELKGQITVHYNTITSAQLKDAILNI